ncbi:MAG: hypothetical protein PHD82_13100, partial [Candidatus Riflebacteria bacterium]|nr:hypothetical protein [Candidatus Riflebacteria bacterium]
GPRPAPVTNTTPLRQSPGSTTTAKSGPLPDNVVPMNSVTTRPADPFADFKNAVGSRSNVCQALLVNARFRKPEDGVMTIQLEQSFAAGKLKEEKNINILLEAARQVYGSVSSIRVIMAGSENAVAPDAAPSRMTHVEQIARIDEQARQKVLQKPSVADAIEVFGGEIIEIED